ncbi:hypothetical protein PSE_1166 [Pseudovibrio sp. FO-BEG1]|nr:hypothetical protein PSE_1166 [Pseudovibrio sp. FO-BEG1]
MESLSSEKLRKHCSPEPAVFIAACRTACLKLFQLEI